MWSSTKPYNLSRTQSLQSIILSKITNAPFYVSNLNPNDDLHVPSNICQNKGTTNSIPSSGNILTLWSNNYIPEPFLKIYSVAWDANGHLPTEIKLIMIYVLECHHWVPSLCLLIEFLFSYFITGTGFQRICVMLNKTEKNYITRGGNTNNWEFDHKENTSVQMIFIKLGK